MGFMYGKMRVTIYSVIFARVFRRKILSCIRKNPITEGDYRRVILNGFLLVTMKVLNSCR